MHFEIPADNTGRAQKFYKQLFGWHVQEVAGIDYWMVHTVATDKKGMPKEAGAINGGLMKRSAPKETPVIVIGVASIDSYLKRVVKLGGKVVLPKQEVGDMGYYARVSDSEENVIGLWQHRK